MISYELSMGLSAVPVLLIFLMWAWTTAWVDADCRERGIPFFGICLGMQCAVIEFARHVRLLSWASVSG